MKNKSKKGFTLVEIMIVVVIIGLLAALAVPAFQKVRVTAQNRSIVNNVRQVIAAADQHFLETGSTTPVALATLVGPNNYIKALTPVVGEAYPDPIAPGPGTITITVPAGVGGLGTDDHTPTAGSTTLVFSY